MIPRTDLTSRRFGRLTVLAFCYRKGTNYYWKCVCDCGKERICCAGNLRKKVTTSCGCFRNEQIVKSCGTHGHASNGKTSTYKIWKGIKARTRNPNSQCYTYYGARGIDVCNEWFNSFEAFLRDMGERPEGLTIERVDNNKGYCKENCRWASYAEQGQNKRDTVRLTYKGETKTISEWADTLQVSRRVLEGRYSNGWTVQRILTTPVRRYLSRPEIPLC